MSASRDDTLYETLGDQRNNGAGQWFFAGKTGGSDIRRGLIAFDITAVLPAGATVTAVSLTLNMSRTIAGNADIGLLRVLADWQEGQANASGNEGSGADADQGDVTWTQRVFKSLDWNTPGGDFFPAASATASVGGIGSYTWESTSQLVADVQRWLDDPASNFGWLLQGDESKPQTAKRFDSKENEEPANWPVLVVEYTAG
ncbi:MAG: DNRLRE domain-containing protein [Chloroflexi bacterium]|nr:DNRLRE domain-containing protein [Chloroflexota bacterium]MCI0829566.1 DNRLRE domain-containing protein [Chloroflexota bacterium]MCI0849030.1 DNRLRE domain-containing protein [Chloroflexota bacterium]MCI0903661.1 DNRLRE domain-containing protein [Chloroflexota bacterium]